MGPALWASEMLVDVTLSNGKIIKKRRCNYPDSNVDTVVSMVVPHIEHLIPGVSSAERVAHICYNRNVNDTTVAHLDGNEGEDGMVAVLSVNAKGSLEIRKTPGEDGDADDPADWDTFLLEPNDLYILRGHRNMHAASSLGGRRGVLVMALDAALWPMPSSSSSPTPPSSSPSPPSPPSSPPPQPPPPPIPSSSSSVTPLASSTPAGSPPSKVSVSLGWSLKTLTQPQISSKVVSNASEERKVHI